MSKKTGGQAFPCQNPHYDGNWDKEPNMFGMTLRDYLAGKVLQGLAANPGGPWQANAMNGWALVNCTLAEVVEVAYQTADAALVERAK